MNWDVNKQNFGSYDENNPNKIQRHTEKVDFKLDMSLVDISSVGTLARSIITSRLWPELGDLAIND